MKSKYGAGYHLEMKLSLTAGGTQASRSFASNPQTPTIARQTSALAEVDCDYASESLTSLVSHIKRTFSGALLVECFGDRATFVIPAEVVQSLATVFAALEESIAALYTQFLIRDVDVIILFCISYICS